LLSKWKSLRDCFVRHANAKKYTKSGSGATRAKEYIYFNQLSFLKDVTNNKTNTTNNFSDENSPQHQNFSEEQEQVILKQ